MSVSSSSWGLGMAAFVIVALPGLFSYLFLVKRSLAHIVKRSRCDVRKEDFDRSPSLSLEKIQVNRLSTIPIWRYLIIC